MGFESGSKQEARDNSGVLEKARAWLKNHKKMVLISAGAVLLGLGSPSYGRTSENDFHHGADQQKVSEKGPAQPDIASEIQKLTDLQISDEEVKQEKDGSVVIEAAVAPTAEAMGASNKPEDNMRVEVSVRLDKNGKFVGLTIHEATERIGEKSREEKDVIAPVQGGYRLEKSNREGIGPEESMGESETLPGHHFPPNFSE